MRRTALSVSSLLLVSLTLSCGGTGQPEAEREEAVASRRQVQGHHRPVAPIALEDATALLPALEAVVAPHVTPKRRVEALYCTEGANPSARAESFADRMRGPWEEVSVQRTNDRFIIRAQKGPYVLRASLGSGADGRCSGSGAVIRVNVFKPAGGGGLGPARRRG